METANILSTIELFEGSQEAFTASGLRMRNRQRLQAFIPKSHEEIAGAGEPADRFYNQAKRWGDIAPRPEFRREAGTRDDKSGLQSDARAHPIAACHFVNVLGCVHHVLQRILFAHRHGLEHNVSEQVGTRFTQWLYCALERLPTHALSQVSFSDNVVGGLQPDSNL
jgi:hypothetical protein